MRLTPRMMRRLTAALMLSSSLTVAAMAFSAQANAQTRDPVSAFLTSNYSYCDARLIAGLWHIDIEQAKAEIGEKILNGLSENIPFFLAEARKRSLSCEWSDTPHSYGDAERIAALWNLASVEEAKAKIAYLYTEGYGAQVVEALAAKKERPAPAQIDEEGMGAFQASSYTYCDAVLIGELWEIHIDEAKAEIGRKILNGYEANIPGFLQNARRIAACDFYDTNVGYADAQRLAAVWGVSLEDAKAKIATYYTNGESDIVTAALRG